MLAIAAAVLFLIALIFELTGLSIAVITPTVLFTLGAICIALHLAGIGHRRPARRGPRGPRTVADFVEPGYRLDLAIASLRDPPRSAHSS